MLATDFFYIKDGHKPSYQSLLNRKKIHLLELSATNQSNFMIEKPIMEIY